MGATLEIDWFIHNRIGVLNGPNPVESATILKQLELEEIIQIVTVRPWPFTMAWKLPDYNLRNVMFRVTDLSELYSRDIFRLIEFCVYELKHDRCVIIWFEDTQVQESLVRSITDFFTPGLENLNCFLAQAMITQRDRFAQLPPDSLRSSGCHYCHDGLCQNDIVCHATTVQCALAIIQSGHILSACQARGVIPKEMARDPRNAAGDPPDYFEYVMWGPGNCSALDKLVLERIIGHVPSWEEFENIFQPAVRFFFRSKDLYTHPRLTFDGIHAKIQDRLELDPYLVLVAIPETLIESKEIIEQAYSFLPTKKVVSCSSAGLHYKDWAQLVYCKAKSNSPDAGIEHCA